MNIDPPKIERSDSYRKIDPKLYKNGLHVTEKWTIVIIFGGKLWDHSYIDYLFQ